MGADQDFHDALRKAIRSNERYAEAHATARRSKKLTGDARDLIEASRDLVREAKKRVARRKPVT